MRFALLTLPVLALFTFAACDSGPKAGEEAEYWGKKLNTESDIPKRDVAMSHLVDLKDKKSLPFLYEALKQTGARSS